jgi:hypothetical protein
MKHPFKVGETYRNSNGTYMVLAIHPPKMQIRYSTGSETTVDIALQERIWERIQAEHTIAEQEQQKAIKRHSITFQGLQESDFKENVAGTSWRSREGLGGLVTRQLSDLNGREFASVAIYRRPQFFVYYPRLPMFSQAEGVKLPKFVVELDSEFVFFGFYIEKSDRQMGSDWYWLRFLVLLSDPIWQEQLKQAAKQHSLHWELRFEESKNSADQYAVTETIRIPGFAEGTQFPTFSTFLDYLHDLPSSKWCNLYLARNIEKSEAIAMKTSISQPISRALNALAPMYWQLVQ